jgi:NADH-quinone oxidoreductase subunit F
MLGSAAIIVMDETTDIPKAVTNISKFYAHESCGQCTPCREGTPWLNKMLKRLVSGQGKRQDLDLLLQITGQMANGMTICVFSDAAVAPVISGITKFRSEFEAYLAKAASPDFALSAPSEVTGKVAGRNAEGIHS